MVVRLARKLALWHSIDRQNRLQISFGQPIYGTDLRKAISVKTVCQDTFDSRRFNYTNWKNKEKEQIQQYKMPQAVFNACAGFKYDPSPDVTISDWPQLTDPEIDQLNQNNLLIKEITCKTREELRLQKEKKEHKEKMKQPKRVQRKKEITEEFEVQEISVVLDLGQIKKQLIQLEKPVAVDDQVSFRQESKSNAEQDIKMEDVEVLHEKPEVIKDQGDSAMLEELLVPAVKKDQVEEDDVTQTEPPTQIV